MKDPRPYRQEYPKEDRTGGGHAVVRDQSADSHLVVMVEKHDLCETPGEDLEFRLAHSHATSGGAFVEEQ